MVNRRGGGAPTRVTPLTIAGAGAVQLWLPADTGITIGAAGVSTWADRSGFGRHATMAVSASQPLLVPNVAKGRPAVRFDGTDDYLIIAHPVLHGFASCSFFIAVANNGGINSNDRTWGNTGGPTDYCGCTFGQVSAGYPDFGIGDTAAEIKVRGPNSRAGSSSPFVFDARMFSAESQAWDNGVAGPAVATAYSAAIACNSDKYIGAFESGGSPLAYWPGDILDIVAVAPALSVAKQSEMRAYLMARYV